MKKFRYLFRVVSAFLVSNLQKVILIIGTIVFVIVMWTSPLTTSGNTSVSGGRMLPRDKVDVGAAFVRGISVIAVTAVLLFVTKGKRKNQD